MAAMAMKIRPLPSVRKSAAPSLRCLIAVKPDPSEQSVNSYSNGSLPLLGSAVATLTTVAASANAQANAIPASRNRIMFLPLSEIPRTTRDPPREPCRSQTRASCYRVAGGFLSSLTLATTNERLIALVAQSDTNGFEAIWRPSDSRAADGRAFTRDNDRLLRVERGRSTRLGVGAPD